MRERYGRSKEGNRVEKCKIREMEGQQGENIKEKTYDKEKNREMKKAERGERKEGKGREEEMKDKENENKGKTR